MDRPHAITMTLKDITLNTPQENLLYDDVLLELAEKGEAGEALRFWESPKHFIVLGRIGKAHEDIKLEATERDNIPVLRRSSGGGTVLQGQGCLNYSLILSKARDPQIADLRKSYQFILNKVIYTLKSLGVEAMFCPVSDIALVENEKKISGNAQKRSKKFILHHGTLLYDFDLNKIEQYLKIPKDIPQYRYGRSHLDFVANVPLSCVQLKNELMKSFNVKEKTDRLNTFEQDILANFLKTKEVCVGPASTQ